jgi:NAD(P)-dependent dehydrogenase (short-subunit alcohol dehydrogenase family)
MKEFSGKVAVITGGASGIGRGIADWCVRAGVKVVLADIEQSRLETAGEELTAAGGKVVCVRTDVSKRADMENLAARAFDKFGQVHLLFNNAGVAAGGAPWEATWNDWEWVMGVNLWGLIHGVKIFTPRMIEQDTECHIVNTASMAGLMAGGISAAYSTTKHAVVGLSESLHLWLEQRKAKVKVSVLCPGMVRTDAGNCERNRPAELKNPPVELSPEMRAGRAAFDAIIARGMPPERVAEKVFEAIGKEQFYIITHPEWMEAARLRTDRLNSQENPVSSAPLLAKILNLQG